MKASHMRPCVRFLVRPGREASVPVPTMNRFPNFRSGSHGQIVLVNQSGVVFANGAQVNVGSLIASTASISDPQRFMNGGQVTFDLPAPGANASVVNAGTITVKSGGLVGLVGHTAVYSGVINARLGLVTIAGAETFSVDLAGDGLINFQIGKPVSRQPLDAQGRKVPLASNTGTINATGGIVALTAHAAGSVVDNVVNAGGVIRATPVRLEGTTVVMEGEEFGMVKITGSFAASGKGPVRISGQATAATNGGRAVVISRR